MTLALAIALAFFAFTYALLAARGPKIQGADFTYMWVAARALWHGQNPYDIVGPSNVPFGGRFYYPLTAAIVSLPLIGLSAMLGGAIVVGLSAGLCAYVVTRRHLWPLLMFVSGPAYLVCSSVQSAPLFTFAALCAPALGVAAAVKPNMALASLAFQSTRRALWYGVLGGGGLLVVSLMVQPSWPVDWLHTLRTSPAAQQYRVPILTIWGLPLWLALLRWRRPEARLLFFMAIVPQTGFFYDQFSIFLVPRSRIEMLSAVFLSHLVLLTPSIIQFDRTNNVILSRAYIPLIIVGVYLPALLMVLRRPNEGRVPVWTERAVSRSPMWLRGTADVSGHSSTTNI